MGIIDARACRLDMYANEMVWLLEAQQISLVLFTATKKPTIVPF
jgi:hypothetical protein